jgi:DNA-binding XRE family transcriptional regulator
MEAGERQVSDETITFVRGNARLERLLSDPEQRARVDAIREGMQQADREHAMGLAMVRHAADLTQQDLADVLGVSQVAIQKTEQRSDMLLSTLRRYLLAAGADMEITVRWPDGRHAKLSLYELDKTHQDTA